MKQAHRTLVWVVALLASMFVATFAHAQPAPIAESFNRHRSVLSCPGAGSAHDYEQCAFEFMRRAACDNQSLVALWPKTGGTFCTHNGRGYDCDKLVVLASGEMFDVVSSAGIASQAPTWNRVETGVFSGTVPAPSCSAPPPPAPPPPGTVSLEDATASLDAAFQARTDRQWSDVERDAILAALRASGWDGGPRAPVSAVQALATLIGRYSGDIADPFPTLDAHVAAARVMAYFRSQRGRDAQTRETTALVDYARSLGYAGTATIPLWLVERIEATIDAYRDELYVAPPTPVDPLAEPAFDGGVFTLGGAPRHWDGVTAFILQYDWFHARARYEAFVDAAQAGGVKTVRVGIAVGTGYLELRPRSGGTFGLGRTRALYPGDGVFTWDSYRAMLADLNRRGLFVEVVPFVTIGAFNIPGAPRPNPDRSVPQALTAASRMSHMQEVCHELLLLRALAVEVANEFNQIGFTNDGQEIVSLAAACKAIDPARKITTSAYHPIWGDYRTMHLDRMTTPRSWSWVVNQLRYPQPGVYTINDEGINADTDGEFGNDPTPANHWANGVLSRLIPGWGYTFHYDRALKGLPPATHDGSQQAIDAWRDGTNAVPAGVQGQYVAFPTVLGADAAVARLGETDGWLLLLGATVDPSVPEWTTALVDARGPHRLYRMSRIVH